MSLRRSRLAFAAVMSSSLLAGLAVDGSSGATPPDTTLPDSGDAPVGIIAIGHSGLTGENSDPERPHQPALENSWATGTNPEVNSIYLRLIEVHPETEGHVANTAQGGAEAGSLAGQARLALREVPTPELVIIQTGALNIDDCPLNEDAVVRFGDSVTAVLDQIVELSPQSRILMTTEFIRPDPAYDLQAVDAYPELRPEMTGPEGPCGRFFGPDGQINTAFFDNVTMMLDAFETEQQRRCDAVPQCRTDAGVRTPFFFGIQYWVPIYDHFNVNGLAAQAEIVWPAVVEVLELDDSTDQTVPSTEPAA